jgi:23S rRNA (adenine2030-N6)-methyltransferase
MNYRHAFHAGGFTDCMKHALLIWLIDALQRKPTPIFVLDTHAGAGHYDLQSDEAQRTAEWRGGIGRLIDAPVPASLTRYLEIVRSLGLYPGSPALIRAMLRPDDHLACCELQPDDVLTLRRRFASDKRVGVHHRDAWEAIGALLPPKERRGLVLIDPAYESPKEFEHLIRALVVGHSRFRNGVFAAWFPIKHRAPMRRFYAALQETGINDIVAAEFCLRTPIDPKRLNGCGLIVINPPFRFGEEASGILNAMLDSLVQEEAGAQASVLRLSSE